MIMRIFPLTHIQKAIIITILNLAAALAVACGPAAQPTAISDTVAATATTAVDFDGPPNSYLPDADLVRLLTAVPPDLGSYARSPQVSTLALWYLDRTGEANAIGVALPRTVAEFDALLENATEFLFSQEQLVSYFDTFMPKQAGLGNGGLNATIWAETFGYDPFGLDLSLFLAEGGVNPPFGVAVIESEFSPETLQETLTALGYEEQLPVSFAIGGERDMIRDSPIMQATGPGSPMNRVALAPGTLIAGNNEALVDLVQTGFAGGLDTSLADDPLVAALLTGIGESHAALLFEMPFLAEHRARGNLPALVPPSEWAELHPYAWAGISYSRGSREDARLTVTLAYADSAAAQVDAEELALRLRTFRPVVFPLGDDDPRTGTPPAELCTMRLPRIQSGSWGSALSISCDYSPTSGSGGHWWRNLLSMWDLDFLHAGPFE